MRSERTYTAVAAILIGALVAFVIITRPARRPAATPATAPDAPAAPAAEPAIKAHRPTMLYHPPDSPYYTRIQAHARFHTTLDAELAGYTGWNRRSRRTS